MESVSFSFWVLTFNFLRIYTPPLIRREGPQWKVLMLPEFSDTATPDMSQYGPSCGLQSGKLLIIQS